MCLAGRMPPSGTRFGISSSLDIQGFTPESASGNHSLERLGGLTASGAGPAQARCVGVGDPLLAGAAEEADLPIKAFLASAPAALTTMARYGRPRSRQRQWGTKSLNARLIESHRCLVPADGFYEWAKPRKAGGRKQPYHIRLRGGGLFAFPALWDEWKDPDGKKVYSCCIVTTDANELLMPIHDRMPAIVASVQFETWLVPKSAPADLKELLMPYSAGEMEAVAVGKLVNSPVNDGPECIVPIERE